MKLIDRYLQEVGKYLPRKNKDDILAEIRSNLSDSLEARVEGEPSDNDVIALLKEMGEPRKLASSYSNQSQYLIGPELYPFFRMVSGIVIAAVIGAQLLAIAIGVWTGGETIQPWQALLDLVTSVPVALGYLLITFMILQHFGVNPRLDEEPWDPRSLPEIEENQDVKRGESIFAIVAGSILVAILAVLPEKIGIYLFPGGQFYPDPVIIQYAGWILLSCLASVGLHIFLLWQGRWTLASRIANIAVDIFSIVILFLLVQGHTAWLAAHGSTGFFGNIERFSVDLTGNWQVFGMEAFRMAFGVALIVTLIEVIVSTVKLIRSQLSKQKTPVILPL